MSYMNIELNVRHEADVAQDGSRRRECVKITFPELVRARERAMMIGRPAPWK